MRRFLAVIMLLLVAPSGAASDDRYPHLEKRVVRTDDEVTSARRHRYRYRRHRAPEIRAEKPVSVEPVSTAPIPFLFPDPPAPPPRRIVEEAHAPFARPIAPKVVRTVSFSQPLVAAEKPKPPKLDTFVAVMIMAVILALLIYTAVRMMYLTPWEKLRRSKRVDVDAPRNVIRLEVNGKRRTLR